MLLDKLLSNLSVHVEPFALVTMSEGWRLHMPGPPGLLLHFVLEGNGVLYGPRGDAHSFAPRHLAVIPAGANHVLECSGEIHDDLYVDSVPAGEQICRVAAGSADRPQVVVGCGMVSVRYGPSLDLFDHLKDVFAVDLSSVPPALAAFEGILAEQSQPIPGTKAMTAALMTQCLIHLFRRLPSVGEDALPGLVALRDERPGSGRRQGPGLPRRHLYGGIALRRRGHEPIRVHRAVYGVLWPIAHELRQPCPHAACRAIAGGRKFVDRPDRHVRWLFQPRPLLASL